MKYLLTNGNSELRADGIFTWTLPALAAKLDNGLNVLVCPNAGACAQLCYARSGTYNFSNVKAAHKRNLEFVINNLDWPTIMITELSSKRYQPTGVRARYFDLVDQSSLTLFQLDWLLTGGKAVRIHDSGDFFTREYFEAWLLVIRKVPNVLFYAYTKEVQMTKEYELPENFILIYSMGGKQDNLIDVNVDRHAEVFPSMDALLEAGYVDQEDSDILAALMPSNKVGIVANNIKHLKKKQGQETFGSLQTARN
jgi:hypothetical protein